MPLRLLMAGMVMFLTACATTPPGSTENICEIFEEKRGWYRDAQAASKRWNSPVPTMMAIMHQESRFRPKARPPRRYYLGFIPGGRLSDAYGFPQAKNSTWDWYRDNTGNRRARRSNFRDAIDFIGWYNHQSGRLSGIAASDTYSLYLAYHEGHGGFNRGTYRSKAWLTRVSQRVAQRADTYTVQLQGCERRLQRSRFLGLF